MILSSRQAPNINFLTYNHWKKQRTRYASQLHGIRCEDKYYQLEEMEDKQTCTTELFLKADRTVIFGNTDGPQYLVASGSWEVEPNTNNFKMTLTRRFSTGQSNTDMGEFNFDVTRTFQGELTMVGDSVGVVGGTNTQADQDVGYFNMIDTTGERSDQDPISGRSRVF